MWEPSSMSLAEGIHVDHRHCVTLLALLKGACAVTTRGRGQWNRGYGRRVEWYGMCGSCFKLEGKSCRGDVCAWKAVHRSLGVFTLLVCWVFT
jgi:hypothetical protein